MKKLIDFLSDRRILIGIGIGIIVSTFIMTTIKININMSKYQIEKKARSMGMEYPNETKVIIDKGVKK